MAERLENLSDRQPLVTYEFDEGVPLETALVSAFLKLGVETDEKPPLYDFLPPEPVSEALRRSDVPVSVSTVVWGYPIVIERGQIRVFGQQGTVAE